METRPLHPFRYLFQSPAGVFDPRRRPWIIPTNASTQQITEQVKLCPSGALSFYMNNEEKK